MSDIWKRRFDKLKMAIEDLSESANLTNDFQKDIPDEPYSESKEYFISNDLEVVDNERYALEHWGKGKYFKAVRVEI